MKKFSFFTKLGISMGIFPRPSPMDAREKVEEKDPPNNRPQIDPGLRLRWGEITASMKTLFP